ncbi:hypothetical protein [Microbacterium azadirachtae]|uniref:IgA FC receptor n=1 Tax=Microbacterium azadirachtae TaxID=582680 RepID=A0A0F0LQP1_9MICO|nr:hypothetical protein [Microbacterium azadirachtae]KJL34590.1 hypothetical protein RS86_00845 [Microbacterium azadirachtae]
MSDPQQFPPAPGAQGAQPAPGMQPAPATSTPAPPYNTAQTGYPASTTQAGYPGAPAARDSGGLARAAFVLAIVSVALSLLSTALFRFVIIRLSYDMHLGANAISLYNIVGEVVLFLAYGVTLILGILGARRSRTLPAGIAIGVGGAGVVGIAFALLSGLIASAL